MQATSAYESRATDKYGNKRSGELLECCAASEEEKLKANLPRCVQLRERRRGG